MSFLDTLSGILRMEPAPPWPVETLSITAGDLPGFFRHSPSRASPWRQPSVRQALGVPAIQRAVTLIANTVGVLSLDAFRDGVRMTERPRVVVRPNPLTTPRVFFRDTANNLATYGEAWWWVAVRDPDGLPMSLVPVPPWEIRVEERPRDPRYPVIRWRDRVMPNADMRQLTLMPDPRDPKRGAGPLQICGAAISVSVEAQEWAANFYAEGGFPSVYLKSDYHFEDEDEPTKIKEKWTATPPNTPHVLSPGLEPGTLPVNPEGANMLTARDYQVGEAARMFGIPGSLLDYAVAGSSLTYQNVGDEFDKFVRSCLWPNYLEPIEQEMSDLLTRSTIARFDLKALLRPDPLTRMKVHELAIRNGVYDSGFAQVEEGITPGSIETAPIPLSPPQAIPTAMPQLSLRDIRCKACSRLLGRAEGTAELRCSHCKTIQLDVVAA